MSATTMEKRVHTAGEQPELTRGGRMYAPTVDILETPDELLLLADVPGARPEDIEINFERGQLTLIARVQPRQDERTNYVLREYGVGNFARTFQIGEGIDASRIQAEVAAGVLKLHLPKAEAARSRKIKVQSA
jgi:HSP20 family molecular chaperone IbpA